MISENNSTYHKTQHKLIVTEKPSVAMEYARVLHVDGKQDGYIENDNYIITWCIGHLVTLAYPEDYDPELKKWKMETLPFLPDTYQYTIIPDVKKQFGIIKKLYHRDDVGEILYAGDSGREGIYIQMLVRQEAGIRSGITERVVWIDSQTDAEIMRGIREAKPISVYKNLTEAGYMRAIEDFAFGINFSRAISIKYGNLYKSKSQTAKNGVIRCGRVMSCVLGMIVERERAIQNFKPTAYYKVVNHIGDKAGGIDGLWKVTDESAYKDSPLLYEDKGFKKEEDARDMIGRLGSTVKIASCTKKTEKKFAPNLFNLAELQAEASKRFKIGPDKVLEIAQSLYEKKLTTYPRTDARVLTTAVAQEIVHNISGIKQYGPVESFADTILSNGWYRGVEKTRYTDDSKVTDHYAIIPTGSVTGIEILNPLEQNVYDLIVLRFFSIFYPPAIYEKYTLDMTAGREHFTASAKVLTEPGYYTVSGIPGEDKENNVAFFESLMDKAGMEVGSTFSTAKGETSPPKRYTSGNIILAMENAGNLIEEEELRAQIKGCGIGTSATRGDIYKKLIAIGYIQTNAKTQVITPTEDGELVYDIMAENLPDFLSPKMTASWEKGLTQIENGELTREKYTGILNNYIQKEVTKIKEKNNGENYKGDYEVKETLFKCPLCGGEITYSKKYGYKCKNHVKKDEGCSFRIGPVCGILIGDKEMQDLLTKGVTKQIRGFVGKNGKKSHAALKLELNRGENTTNLTFDFEAGAPHIVCPKCGGAVKEGPKGYFCENYKTGCKLEGLWKKPCWITSSLTANDVQALLFGRTIEKPAKTKTGKAYKKRLYYDMEAGEIKERKE